MKTKHFTRLSVDLVPDFHEELKDMVQARAKTLKSYVIEALEERLQKDREEEDRMWDELAEKARQKGFANAVEAEEILNNIRNV